MNYTDNQFDIVYQMYSKIMSRTYADRAENIRKKSPYSQQINRYISTTKELSVYMELNLHERVITRPSLVLDIDLQYRTDTGETNAERMAKGKAPYDALTGYVVDLHHLGQQYSAPYAELPHCIHDAPGTNGVLHHSKARSWRKDQKLVAEYNKEATRYWKLRKEMLLCAQQTLEKTPSHTTTA